MKIRLTPYARKEVNEAADYYEAGKVGLGTEFADEFYRVYERIMLHPHAGIPFKNKFRLQLLNKFPYTVYYSINENDIAIVAIAHQHRKPGYWLDRIKDNNVNEPAAVYSANIMVNWYLGSEYKITPTLLCLYVHSINRKTIYQAGTA